MAPLWVAEQRFADGFDFGWGFDVVEGMLCVRATAVRVSNDVFKAGSVRSEKEKERRRNDGHGVWVE